MKSFIVKKVVVSFRLFVIEPQARKSVRCFEIDMVKQELRVTSYELRVTITSYELKA